MNKYKHGGTQRNTNGAISRYELHVICYKHALNIGQARASQDGLVKVSFFFIICDRSYIDITVYNLVLQRSSSTKRIWSSSQLRKCWKII